MTDLLRHKNPVGFYPAAIGLLVGLSRYETELGTNPLTLAHLELRTTFRELLAVRAIGEMEL